MIEASHLLRRVVRPTLEIMQEESGYPLATVAAEQLLLATAAQESQCGRYLEQLNGGPGMGIYQVEQATFEWARKALWHRHPRIWMAIDRLVIPNYPDNMRANLIYATAFARGRYWLVKDPLPQPGDRDGMWGYYKEHWNSMDGKAERGDFMLAWAMHLEGAWA